MATDGPTPAPCDTEIFQNGEPVAVLDASSNAVERWVLLVARTADAKLDWHYSGGRAQVLLLGDSAGRERVDATIDQLENQLEGRILNRLPPGSAGLFRNRSTAS